MKHFIMGTAGHVDHGKTSLIRALTGFDCDTHKQEKQRGITINLGFTHLNLADNISLGIVDVPGHKDFINTMVSGVSGIDFCLLVIAADDGIMPQTKEHLQIMEHLGVDKGIIVLSKADLVDEDLLELAELEVSEFVENTFLENAPIIPVSNISKSGFETLKDEINNVISSITPKSDNGLFRMYIDRIFTVQGFGTVINGSVLSGKLTNNEEIFLQPGNKALRVRNMQHHGMDVDKIFAGDRASLNVVGIQKSEFERGMAITSKEMRSSNLVDAKITLIDSDIKLGIWNQLILLLGTNKVMIKLHLLDKNIAVSEEENLAQIHFPHQVHTVVGDKFILRNSSNNLTVAAGEIIDTNPLKHKRRREKTINEVKQIAEGKLKSLILAELKKTKYPRNVNSIAFNLNVTAEEILEELESDSKSGIVIYNSNKNYYLLTKEENSSKRRAVIETIKDYHKKNSIIKTGLSKKEISGVWGSFQKNIDSIFIDKFVAKLESDNLIKQVENTFCISSHEVNIDKSFFENAENILSQLNNIGMEFVPFDELSFGKGLNANQVFDYLKSNNKILNNGKDVISITNYKRFLKILIDLSVSNNGIKLSEVRDHIGTNRKKAMELLEFTDSKGITFRRDNERYLTTKGKEYISENI